MSFKNTGFPSPLFNPLGFRTSGNLLQDLIKNCGLLSYNTPEADKVGYESRPAIKAKYIDQAGLTADIGLSNEPLTYLDADTLLDVAASTDGVGLFTFPSAKVANIKIPSDGSIFYLQEGTGDTIADSINGRVVKLSANATFTDVNNILSQADQVGYSISDGSHWAWDETLLDVIFNSVVIPNINTNLSVAYYSETPLIDPLTKALQDAHCTMYLDPNKADGTSKGVNSPLTNPLVDLIGDNDATLVNFDGTVTSGYDDLTLPNTNVKTFLKSDGTKSYCIIADDPSIDPTGTQDFAMMGIINTDGTITTTALFAKTLDSFASSQITLYTIGDGRVGLRIAGAFIAVASVGEIVANTEYSYLLKRIGGVLKFTLIDTETYNTPNTLNLISQPNVSLLALSSDAGGATFESFSNVYNGPFAFLYNYTTGLNETDVDNAYELFKASFFL